MAEMLIDTLTLDRLSAQAAASQRLRMNMDMRNGAGDLSRRMLNALEPGTVLPVHRHGHTSETVVIVRGELEETFYDEEGNATQRFRLGGSSGNFVLQVPAGQWHSSTALQPGTVIFEAKDGPYQPLTPEDILS